MVENCKTLRKAGWSKIREGENASLNVKMSIFAIVFVWYFYCKLFIKPTGKFGEVFFGMFNFVNNKALQYAADFLPVFVFFNAVNIGVSFFQIDCANAIRGKVA